MSDPLLYSQLPAPVEGHTFDLAGLLRKGTADIHELIEERVPVFREDFELPAYIRLVEQFFGFWCPVEERLAELEGLKHPGLGMKDRFKRHLLIEDLQILGRDPNTVRRCEELPRLDTFFEGLGCLYVLEGSTLGAQMIAQRLDKKLHIGRGSGASFFNAYGALVGRQWMEFKDFTSSSVQPQHANAVVDAARQTFMCFYDWLAIRPGDVS